MNEIEILESQLQTTTNRYGRVKILNQLIWALGRKDLARSTFLLDEVASLIQRAQEHDTQSTSSIPIALTVAYQVNAALLASYTGDYEDAIRHAQDVLTQSASHRDELSCCKALEIIGICHIRLGNPSDALEQLLEALRIARALDDQERQATIYNIFAILYVNLGDHANGAIYFQKSLALSRQIGDRVSEARALVNLCMSYCDLGEHAKSVACGEQSLDLARRLELPTMEMWASSNLANTYVALGEAARAFTYFQQASMLAEEVGDIPEQANTLLGMARAFLQKEQHALAKSYATLVLEIGQTHKQLGIQFEAHEILAAICKVEGDFAAALQHFEAFHYIKERIFNKEADEKLKQLEVAHRTGTAQRDAEIYQLRYVELQHEITEREHAQKALLHAQKLESLGVLAGGVAHDFNNLLVGILGQIDLALHKLDKSHPAERNLIKANYAVEQAATLARKMLAYSGRGHFRVDQCSLTELISDNQELWQGILGSHCKLHCELPEQESAEEHCLVEIDKNQIEQMFLNLLTNAAEADARNVTICLTRCVVDTQDFHYWQYTAQPLTNGRYIQIIITDDGCGMDSSVLDRLFDPFFTTKFTGRGLGMAASLGIIRGHGGGITAQSQPTVGTSFDIVLPMAVSKPFHLPIGARDNVGGAHFASEYSGYPLWSAAICTHGGTQALVQPKHEYSSDTSTVSTE